MIVADATWAEPVVDAVVRALSGVADPSRAPAMQAYMKDVAPFLGVCAPVRRAAIGPVWRAIGPAPSAAAVAMAVWALWRLEEREYAYAALDLIECNAQVLDAPTHRRTDAPTLRRSSALRPPRRCGRCRPGRH